MSPIRFHCTNPACRTILTASAELGGRQVRCGCCGQVVRVPDRPSLRKRPKRSQAA